ncbi:MAG: FHA domain-containing protein [Myxococcota bacterium]
MSTPPPQTPQLVELDGPNAGRVHPLTYGSHQVGRGGRVSVRLDHDDVSRQHASIEVSAQGMLVQDAGSKNGVWSDGRRLEGPTMLVHDDRFSLGELNLRVIHPASQVTRALAAGGESTVTINRPPPEPRPELRSLLIPLVGVVIFGTLVVVMLLR